MQYLVMEMTMNSINAYQASRNTTMGAHGSSWTTEFERIHLMTAARIRGEQLFARQRTSIARPVFARGR
jgi:hypothetical protein